MARVLLLILLVWILYVVVKRIYLGSTENHANKKDKPAEKPSERIVQCWKCGLHVPESESHLTNNVVICNNSECNTISKHD